MADKNADKLGDILVEEGYISRQQLEDAKEDQKLTGERLGDILIKKGWIAQAELTRAMAKQTGISAFDLSNYIIEPEVIGLVPEDISLKYKVIPVFKMNYILTVAMIDPTNVFVIDELSRITSCTIEPVLADEMAIRKAQDQYYGGAGTIREIVNSIDKEKLKDSEHMGEEAPIVKLVNILIVEAVQANASDIHIEPEEKFVGVRYRIDGVLNTHSFLPKDLQGAVISRFKIMANLDIAEKRMPQDGRIMMKVGTKDIDFRASTCPTVHGENVVLRILDKSSMTIGLESLGFPKDSLQKFESVLAQPYGIILVTGPTGSGKTTTLYSALQKLNREDINLMTVEDPVEYQFPRIRQVQINVKAGLTFATALRSFLRQDPDVVMVGEIRDKETAEIAVQAALTGHMVLSTLHTNDSPTTFTRLVDMGIEPFLVSSSILAVLAQRLMRKVCGKCKEEYVPSPAILESLDIVGKVSPGLKLFRGRGCQLCSNTGYKGRTGIYELLCVDMDIQDMILKKASSDDIRDMAVKKGMRTLRQSAIEKMLAGLTTPEEVARVTQSI
jgi:type IV pilus assembly protein PilB